MVVVAVVVAAAAEFGMLLHKQATQLREAGTFVHGNTHISCSACGSSAGNHPIWKLLATGLVAQIARINQL